MNRILLVAVFLLVALCCLTDAKRKKKPPGPKCVDSETLDASQEVLFGNLEAVFLSNCVCEAPEPIVEPSCSEEVPLGMEGGKIKDGQISASSVWKSQPSYGPPKARLNTKVAAAAWCSGGTTDPNPWIQVDFDDMVHVSGLGTQGRHDYDQWVTMYRVDYSDAGQSWDHVICGGDAPRMFLGNTDRNTIVHATLEPALYTRAIRILPVAWESHCSMRFELFGCYLSE